ncbi:hypothetical protein [Dysgonomonas sp. HGC4]|uniref:hypothetical protein n=1 Tax=Dysgonomonas sp. HGC4 TaxID=1658009 RepID=UPI00068150A2|nr:hypothetical protein [Dysgonomonas sp. HGC4]MBD8348189.1 hypothetical protein [Dysgonomonas sp. HGC4]
MSDPINGPTYAMWQSVQYSRYNYIDNEHSSNEDVVRLAIIARHICPDKKLFDNWLRHILKRCIELFPYIKLSNKPVIPRQFFFEKDYNYQSADHIKIINEFLSSLNYKENETLNSPEIMKEEGFQGTPYKYEPQ